MVICTHIVCPPKISEKNRLHFSACYNHQGLWLGAAKTAATVSGQLVWESDGSEVSAAHTNWDDAEPNFGGVSCLQKNGPDGSMKWRDVDCYDYTRNLVICESV